MKFQPSICAIVLLFVVLPFTTPVVARAQNSPAVPASGAMSSGATSSRAVPSAGGASAVDPAKEAAIRQLIEISGGKALAQQMVTQGSSMMRSSLIKSCADNLPCQQLANLVLAKMQSKFAAGMDDLLNLLVPIYARHYSIDEINGLIQFYQTPLGQKLLSTNPQVAIEAQKSSYAWGAKIGADSVKEVLQEHPELANAPSPFAH